MEVEYYQITSQIDRFAMEWILDNFKDINLKTDNIWLMLNHVIKNKFQLDMGASNWKTRWLSVLDGKIMDEMKLSNPEFVLPIICAKDSEEVKIKKANMRLPVLRKMYKKVTATLKLGNEVVKSELFKGMSFLLPWIGDHGEDERRKLERLIRTNGGTVSTKLGQVDKESRLICPGRDDDVFHLHVRYSVKIYRPLLIYESIEKGKPIDKKMFSKHRWHIPDVEKVGRWNYSETDTD